MTWPSYDGSIWSFAFAKKSVSAGRAGSAEYAVARVKGPEAFATCVDAFRPTV